MNNTTRNLAIMFADIAGSTALYEKYGDASALEAINRCLDVMRTVTLQQKGRVVKTIGDEVMSVFECAEDAFCASCEIQWRVGDLPICGIDKIAVRIGFHFGQTIEQSDDVFGDSVNIAARLVELARAGQILTSARTIEVLGSMHVSHTRKLNGVSLRGMSYSEAIYEGLWQDDENITALLSGTLAVSRDHANVKLRYDGEEVDLTLLRDGVSFGRDPSNTFVVYNRKASRMHARIAWRRDKLMLVDESANGTFVTDEYGRETVLRREEMSLQGRGVVSFGEPVSVGGPGLLEYVLGDHLDHNAVTLDAAAALMTH